MLAARCFGKIETVHIGRENTCVPSVKVPNPLVVTLSEGSDLQGLRDLH